jgi:adenosylcobinamide kinase/adenosylcobinamide-phosphate guanylyltransferase
LPIDEAMKDRIKHHQASRPQTWQTMERDRDFERVISDPLWRDADLFLLDCVTILVTNHMVDANLDYETCSMEDVNQVEQGVISQVKKLLDLVESQGKDLVLVSNEVGLGLVPAYRMGNYFRDIAGRVNQYIASRAHEVYFCVSGIPMRIKGDESYGA